MKLQLSLKSGVALIPLLLCQPSLVLAQSAPSAFTVGHRYDLLGRETGVISPSSSGTAGPFLATRITYNQVGQEALKEEGYLASWQSESVDPSNWSGFTISRSTVTLYDNASRVAIVATDGPDGTAQTLTHYNYEAAGRLLCTAIRMNPAVYSTLPLACNLSTQAGAGPDRITKNVYDAAGQLIQVRKAVGTSLETAEATYAYSANGKQTDMVDANGNRAQFVYDGFDRQVQWIFPSSARPAAFDPSTPSSALASAGSANSGDYEAYGYDNNGNRTSLRKRDGSTLSYTYDALNRVTSKIVPGRGDLPGTDTRSVYYSYDYQNHQVAARFDNSAGEGVSNVFDGLGRQTSSSLSMDGVTRTASFQYDADGNRTRMTYPDGNYVTYAYDGLDRPALILRSGSASAPIASYSYDAAGRRTAFNGGVSTSYGYDGIGRLTSLTNAPNSNASYANTYGFGYSPASQIISLSKSKSAFVFNGAYNVSRGYSVNGLNQYTGAGAASFVYDANGNLTGDASTTFLYDIENRLVAAGGAKQAQLRYDPLGRLYEVAAPSGTTRFFYNGDELIGEYDTSGNLLRRYAHGADLKSDDPIAWYEGSGFDSPYERFLRPDWQGSIALVTDNAGSSIYATNTFDEYGIPGGNNAGRFQYTGQAWLTELGMYYYKARMYSPTLGRFMQTDPIGYKDQVNLYAYVANDPLNKLDFSGESTAENLWNLTAGTIEMLAGAVIIGGGDGGAGAATVGSGGLAAPVAAPVAVAATTVGAGIMADGARRAGNGLAGLAGSILESRNKNKVAPDQGATGPHSVIKRGPDGKITNYAEYKPNPQNPSGHQEVKRVDVTGRDHTNPDGTSVPTPHVKETGSAGVRPARPDELP